MKAIAFCTSPCTGAFASDVRLERVSFNNLTEFMAFLRTASILVREQLLNYKPLAVVYVGPGFSAQEARDALTATQFTAVQDFKSLARYDHFTVRADVFLRLCEVWRVERELRGSVHSELLVDQANLDHFTWSMWLANQHVEYFTCLKFTNTSK